MWIVASVFGCAQNEPPENEPCARAVARLEQECGFTVNGSDAGAEYNCTGAAECAADCLYTTSCDDIRKNTPAFTDCLEACPQ